MTTIEAPKTTPKEVTTADVLERAADLLEEFGFCQDHPGENADGRSVVVTDSSVTRFCMWGAMVRAEFDLSGTSPYQVDPLRHDSSICALVGRQWIDWAVAPGRTKSEVVALLREAAERSRETA